MYIKNYIIYSEDLITPIKSVVNFNLNVSLILCKIKHENAEYEPRINSEKLFFVRNEGVTKILSPRENPNSTFPNDEYDELLEKYLNNDIKYDLIFKLKINLIDKTSIIEKIKIEVYDKYENIEQIKLEQQKKLEEQYINLLFKSEKLYI